MSRESRVQRAQAKVESVFVGYCHGHEIDAAFHTCLTTLLMYDAKHKSRVINRGELCGVRSGPQIASSRNKIVRTFLDHVDKPNLLWMVDTDMTFPADMLERMAAHIDDDTPVLGALCFAMGHTGRVEPTLKVMIREDDHVRFETVWDYPPDSLVSIDATGAACLLVHRSALEKLDAELGGTSYPFFAEAGTDAGGTLSEDVTFCARLRGIGIPVKAHTGIVCGHMKKQIVDQETYLAYRRGITEEGEDEYQARQLARIYGGGGYVVGAK